MIWFLLGYFAGGIITVLFFVWRLLMATEEGREMLINSYRYYWTDYHKK